MLSKLIESYQPSIRSSKPFYERRHVSAVWTRLVATRLQSRMKPNWTAMGIWTEGPEKQLSYVLPLFIATDCQWTMQEWKLKLFRKHAHVARRLSEIPHSRELEWINSLPYKCHLGRCGGSRRRLQAHELVKRALMDMVLSNPNPGGAAFPTSSILIEPPHLRRDKQV